MHHRVLRTVTAEFVLLHHAGGNRDLARESRFCVGRRCNRCLIGSERGVHLFNIDCQDWLVLGVGLPDLLREHAIVQGDKLIPRGTVVKAIFCRAQCRRDYSRGSRRKTVGLWPVGVARIFHLGPVTLQLG